MSTQSIEELIRTFGSREKAPTAENWNNAGDESATEESAPVNHEDQNKTKVQRHSDFYSPGLVVIQIENTLYRVDIKTLKHFKAFQDAFELTSEHGPSTNEGQVDANPITLSGVTRFEFESVLKLFDASSVLQGTDDTAYEHWAGILRLATMWDSNDLRERAIQEIERMKTSPAKLIHLSLNYDIQKWMEPACIKLCERTEFIKADEIPLIDASLLAALCRIREQLAAKDCRECATRTIPEPCRHCNDPFGFGPKRDSRRNGDSSKDSSKDSSRIREFDRTGEATRAVKEFLK
ncbi:hypothetical protein FRC03_012095 [Tulasnella sp. 419]|nr:hypothetical protein FRC03_012095 [Tulasnella sp. 419]